MIDDRDEFGDRILLNQIGETLEIRTDHLVRDQH